jgi:hypothetical protein
MDNGPIPMAKKIDKILHVAYPYAKAFSITQMHHLWLSEQKKKRSEAHTGQIKFNYGRIWIANGWLVGLRQQEMHQVR